MTSTRRAPRGMEQEDPDAQVSNFRETSALPQLPNVEVIDDAGGGEDPFGGAKEGGSRLGETPRERQDMGGAQATTSRPRVPTSMAGSTMTAGVVPFEPMSGPSPTSMTSARRGSMYGSQGGLLGGGFGVPLDPTSNQASDPITSLISQLLSRRG